MDFTLIERHPWMTTAIVGVGALIVYVFLKRRSGSTSDGSGYSGGVTVQSDPNAAAAALAQYQTQAQLQALGIQSNTQLGLAGIAAGPNYTVEKSADVANMTTAAQLQASIAQIQAQLALGLNTQQSQVEMARIDAGIQGKYIDAIIAAFGGHTSTSPTPIQSNPVVYNPTPQTPNTFSIPVSADVYNTTQISRPSSPGSNGALVGTMYDSSGNIVPGSVPLPGGVPVQMSAFVPTLCDPRDVTCVMANVNRSVAYQDQTARNQSTNNRNQCLANAERNKDFPNYAALVAACG